MFVIQSVLFISICMNYSWIFSSLWDPQECPIEGQRPLLSGVRLYRAKLRKNENSRTGRRLTENKVATPFGNRLLISISFSCFLHLSRIKPSALLLPINYKRLNSLRIFNRSLLSFFYFMLSDSSDYRFLPLLFWYFYITLFVCLDIPVSSWGSMYTQWQFGDDSFCSFAFCLLKTIQSESAPQDTIQKKQTYSDERNRTWIQDPTLRVKRNLGRFTMSGITSLLSWKK
jgi:hypothetical protein